MGHVGGFVEEDERAPRFLLSMRVKYAVGCMCLFLAVSLMALSGIPHFVQALQGISQGENPDDGGNISGNVSGPELVWEFFEPGIRSRAKGIAPCDDGGFMVATEQVNQADSSELGVDIVLVKVDSQGVKLWEKTYGEVNTTNRVECITTDGNGGFLIAARRGYVSLLP